MTPFKDLTDKEVLSLSDAQIDNYILLAKAEAGIKLLDYPVEPKYAAVPPPDITMYYSTLVGENVGSTKKEDIDKLNALLQTIHVIRRQYRSIKTANGYAYIAASRDSEQATLSSIALYSEKLYATIEPVDSKNKQLESEYKALLEEYKVNDNLSKDIVEEIRDRVSAVVNNHNKVVAAYNQLVNTYLPLAEGNIIVAIRFLRNAYNYSDTFMSDIYAYDKEAQNVLNDGEPMPTVAD